MEGMKHRGLHEQEEWDRVAFSAKATSPLPRRLIYGGGEAGFPKNLFPLQKSTPAYRILHHTLIKHREMMISIS